MQTHTHTLALSLTHIHTTHAQHARTHTHTHGTHLYAWPRLTQKDQSAIQSASYEWVMSRMNESCLSHTIRQEWRNSRMSFCLIWMSHVRWLTHPYTWKMTRLNVLIGTYQVMSHVRWPTHPYLSYIRGRWRVSMSWCSMTCDLLTWHDSWLYVMWHDSFLIHAINVTRFIGLQAVCCSHLRMCHVTRTYVCHAIPWKYPGNCEECKFLCIPRNLHSSQRNLHSSQFLDISRNLHSSQFCLDISRNLHSSQFCLDISRNLHSSKYPGRIALQTDICVRLTCVVWLVYACDNCMSRVVPTAIWHIGMSQWLCICVMWLVLVTIACGDRCMWWHLLCDDWYSDMQLSRHAIVISHIISHIGMSQSYHT